MSQQNIDFGTFPDDPNADAIRIAFQKVQENFSQLFAATASQAVLSVNRLPGAGITVSSPTGNVIVTANVAQVQFSTSTLSLGRAPTQSPTAQDSSITSSSQTMYINLPTTVSNVDIINLNSTLIANTVNVNLSLNGNVGNFTGNLAGANLTTGGILLVTGNANVGNVNAGNGTFTSTVSVTANVTAGNVYANSGTVGANTGAFANNVTAGNVYANSGTIGASLLTGTLTTNAQPNITSLGTLTALTVTGNVSAGNIAGGNLVSANYFSGSGANLSAIAGANVTGTVANATYAISAGSAATAGTVTTNAQPNITSVGTLTALDVTANVTAGNVYSNSGIVQAQYLKGDGSNISNITVGAGSFIVSGNSNVSIAANSNVTVSVAGNANVVTVTGTGANIAGYANVTGNINAGNIIATLLSGTLTTAAQPNIASLGTLTGLAVSGATDLGPVGNITITGGASNYFLRTDGAGVLSWVNATTLTTAPGLNTQVLFNDAGSFGANASFTFNKATGNANLGNIGATYGIFSNVTGTLTTNAQPNITSVGTLTSLLVNGNINAANITVGAGTITTYNLSSNGNVDFTQSANVTLGSVSNLHISGGSSGYVLSTDGSGTLSWILGGASSNIYNGNSNVNIPAANGNINFSSAGNANVVVVTGTSILRNSRNIPTFAFTSATPPSSPLNGDQWFNTTTGVLFEYLNDGTTSQWVDIGTIPLTVGVNATTLANGTSNVNIPVISGNVNISAAGNANIVTVTGTGVNVAGTLNVTGNTFLATTSGNVGIGTSTPQVLLDVQGTATTTIRSRSDTLGIVAAEHATSGGSLNIRAGSGYTVLNSVLATDPLLISTAATERMRITSDGNVGIGNTAPTDKLSVNGNVSANYFIGNGSQLTGVLPSLVYRSVTANTSITSADALVIANGVLTITLPAASTVAGRQFYVKNINPGNALVTINPVGADLIDGKSNASIAFYNTMLGVVSISTGWLLF